MSDLQGNPLSDALARLDADIAATEERLKRLREMRDSIPQFVEQYVSSPLEISDVESLSKNRDDETETSGSYTSLVFNVLKESPNTALDVGDVGKDSAARAGKTYRKAQRATPSTTLCERGDSKKERAVERLFSKIVRQYPKLLRAKANWEDTWTFPSIEEKHRPRGSPGFQNQRPQASKTCVP
ncbi:hypothetical protein H7I76_23555 [Mycolicibacterium vaccae]|nr:hypothetical protein [Mycolicibacterium vaccae]